MNYIPPDVCGARAVTGPCILPRGHNMGRVDVPEYHQAEGEVRFRYDTLGALQDLSPFLQKEYKDSIIAMRSRPNAEDWRAMYNEEVLRNERLLGELVAARRSTTDWICTHCNRGDHSNCKGHGCQCRIFG